MNIPDAFHKLKGRLREGKAGISIVLVVLLVGVGAFGLGRLSALESKREPVRIFGSNGEPIITTRTSSSHSPDTSQAASAHEALREEDSTLGEVVGSKNSNKYHLPWCSGAQRIAAANRVTFASKEEAEKAGYVPASNCPGL